jgi:hypothetical protein
LKQFEKKRTEKIFSLIFAKKNKMEHKKRPSGLYWVLFLLSVAAFFGVYAVGGGYCSMILPFNVTFFAMAMDLM